MEKNKVIVKRKPLEDMDEAYVPPRQRVFQLKAPQTSEPEVVETKSTNTRRNAGRDLRFSEAKDSSLYPQSEVKALAEEDDPSEQYGDRMKISKGTAVKENPLKGDAITDKVGLQRAYQQGDAYAYGDTLYVAGSHTGKDWFDDATKVPDWQYVPPGIAPAIDFMNSTVGRKMFGTGDLTQSTRYQAAEKALKANPNIKNIVGHSLGGSVALELQKNYPNLKSRTYGAPVLDPLGGDAKAERYRNAFDPVAMFDNSAKMSVKTNPFDSWSLTHDYSNIAGKFQTGGNDQANGWQNPDGSTSLTQ